MPVAKNIQHHVAEVKKKRQEKQEGKAFVPYEENHALIRLGLAVTVVPRGQASGIEHLLDKNESAFWFVTHGKGTVTSDISSVLGTADVGKHIVLGVLRMDKWASYKEAIGQRFAVSPFAKGISFIIAIDSVVSVSMYKMMANLQTIDKTINPAKKNKEEKKMEEKIENAEAIQAPAEVKKKYESIFAIVNNGYTDLVMDAARKAGARGGTIINARGTGNKEIAKFFGVVITPEKEIVMILVSEDIRDEVLKAINKEAGIDTQGNGIAFSVPVSDVVGIKQ